MPSGEWRTSMDQWSVAVMGTSIDQVAARPPGFLRPRMLPHP
jgi:hypothetical protein